MLKKKYYLLNFLLIKVITYNFTIRLKKLINRLNLSSLEVRNMESAIINKILI